MTLLYLTLIGLGVVAFVHFVDRVLFDDEPRKTVRETVVGNGQ